MDDFAQIHLVSPPSSLPDGLLDPRVSTPPVPRPRKATSLFLSSTPKHPPNVRQLPLINGHDYHLSKNTRNHHQEMHRAPSLDSATHRDLPLSPITRTQDVQSDSETEEDGIPSSHRSISRLNNGSHHGKHFKKPQQHSHSLPTTPRVSGSSQPSCLNGNFPLGTSPSYNGIPCLLTPHTLNSNQDNISQASHYITCQTDVSHLDNSVFLNQQDPKLPGAIDYSSLPLPQEDVEPVRRTTDMSRHLSEPCITESQVDCNNLPYSSKRWSSKNRHRTVFCGKENGVMDNIKESGQSEGETEEISALEVHWRFIQTLVAELNTTKCSNRKMMAELHQAKMEIQVLKASLDSYTESGLQPGAITEMVSQIHAAQKVRDEAMMSRIKLANEERDAALTHTRALMDKLSLSPRSNAEQVGAGDIVEQELPSGGNSSCTSSPHRSDRRHQRSSLSSLSTAPQYTSATPACTQGSEARNTCERESNTLAQLSTLEEELRTLRLATTIHHTMHEASEASVSSSVQGISRVSAEYMEGLCSQLRESEASRWQLHDQCTRLERLVNVLRKKVNGLSTLEPASHQEGPKLTLVDLTVHGPSSECPPSSGQHLPTSTSSEGEPRDSLSSLESVETASASSWRRGNIPNSSHSSALHSNNVSHHGASPSAATFNSHHIHHTSFIHSALSQSNSEKSIPITSSHSSLSSSGQTPHMSPHHRQQQNLSAVTERDHRNIPGVTIVGPITEL